MLSFCFWILLTILCAGNGSSTPSELPSWISNNPAFANPELINALENGSGSITFKDMKSSSWLVTLNDEKGYGVEINLEKMSLDPDADHYLMISAWPLNTKKFNYIKFLTGEFTKPQKLYIPNTKVFFVMFGVELKGKISPEVQLTFKRYGTSYEIETPSTEHPIRKQALYEVQFRGKNFNDYINSNLIENLKEAIRLTAESYCIANNIKFNNNIPTNEMVFIKRISFCPFEWPDRDVCASIEHSVFVSGTQSSKRRIVVNYELTADHLRDMWMTHDHPEVEKLGITIFKLPETSETILWWVLIVSFVLLSAFGGAFIFWRVEKYSGGLGHGISTDDSTVSDRFKRKRKSTFKLSRHQQIPAFMFTKSDEKLQEEVLKTPNIPKLGKNKPEESSSSELPIKNYSGSMFFFSNKAYEDEEEITETPSKRVTS